MCMTLVVGPFKFTGLNSRGGGGGGSKCRQTGRGPVMIRCNTVVLYIGQNAYIRI